MTKDEFKYLYVGRNRVVHCSTRQSAIQFLKLASTFGYYDGVFMQGHFIGRWERFEHNTVYRPYDHSYGDITFHQKMGDIIIRFQYGNAKTKKYK